MWQLCSIEEFIHELGNSFVRPLDDSRRVCHETTLALLSVTHVQKNAGERREPCVPHVNFGTVGNIVESACYVTKSGQRMLTRSNLKGPKKSAKLRLQTEIPQLSCCTRPSRVRPPLG